MLRTTGSATKPFLHLGIRENAFKTAFKPSYVSKHTSWECSKTCMRFVIPTAKQALAYVAGPSGGRRIFSVPDSPGHPSFWKAPSTPARTSRAASDQATHMCGKPDKIMEADNRLIHIQDTVLIFSLGYTISIKHTNTPSGSGQCTLARPDTERNEVNESASVSSLVRSLQKS